MHPHQPIRLHHHLNIIRDLVAHIQPALGTRLVRGLEGFEHLCFVDTDLARDLGEPLVSVVARFVDHVDVEEVVLQLEQLGGERVEFLGGEFQDCRAGFVGERGGWVPGLDLLAEDDLDAAGVFLFDDGEDGSVEGVEHFSGKWADIVEIFAWKFELG